MVVSTYKGMELLYKHNDKNDIATLTLWFDRGSDADPLLPFSADYVRYLGTPEKSAQDISVELYSLASKWNMNVGSESHHHHLPRPRRKHGKVLILGERPHPARRSGRIHPGGAQGRYHPLPGRRQDAPGTEQRRPSALYDAGTGLHQGHHAHQRPGDGRPAPGNSSTPSRTCSATSTRSSITAPPRWRR